MKNARANAQSNGRIDIQCGLYRIIAGLQGNEHRAIAYLGGKQRASVSGNTVDDAIKSLEKILEERVVRLREARIDDLPSAEEFLDAFESIRNEVTERQLRLLKAHRRYPEAVASLSDLARDEDLSTAAAEAAYARLGKRLGKLMEFSPAPNTLGPTLAGILVLAMPEAEQDLQSPLRLRAPVMQALDAFCRVMSSLPT